MPVLMDGKNLHTGNIKQIYLTVDVGRGVGGKKSSMQ